jgi:hypothetical protein
VSSSNEMAGFIWLAADLRASGKETADVPSEVAE